MSFQHFRLEASFGPSSSYQLPSVTMNHAASGSNHAPMDPSLNASSSGQFQVQLDKPDAPASSSITSKAPYGSGNVDDGYTMVFENMDAFEAWRAKEEEEKVVEFVKGDTHGSKADPPRFKDHTKLVCARHQRSGRKKYVKKHPERVRKIPSRKIEGVGCPASISYKTYYETPEVRACYNSQHSHEIGLANLPFTRRGRRAQVEWEKDHKGRKGRPPKNRDAAGSPSVSSITSLVDNAVAGPLTPPPYPPPLIPSTASSAQHNRFASSISMLAPLPQFPPAPAPAASTDAIERWDRMGTLFSTVKDYARTFQYPEASVAALESVLIRLYLESPIHGTGPVSAPPVSEANRNVQNLDQGGGDPMQSDDE